jgi:predicted nuclease with TOPRIM domain
LLVKDAQIDLLQKLIGEHMSMKYQFSNFNEAERILAEKDLRHSELLGKMQEMANIIKSKNDEIAQLKYENDRIQGLLESLQHTVYMLTKK